MRKTGQFSITSLSTAKGRITGRRFFRFRAGLEAARDVVGAGGGLPATPAYEVTHAVLVDVGGTLG